MPTGFVDMKQHICRQGSYALGFKCHIEFQETLTRFLSLAFLNGIIQKTVTVLHLSKMDMQKALGADPKHGAHRCCAQTHRLMVSRVQLKEPTPNAILFSPNKMAFYKNSHSAQARQYKTGDNCKKTKTLWLLLALD